MDTDADQDTNVSVVVNLGDPDVELNSSSNGDMTGKLGSAGEVLSRVELDLACCSEKLLNLSLLMMHVPNRESDFEALASEGEHILTDSAENALEFDLLVGVLDSEVTEVDSVMANLEVDIINAREMLASFKGEHSLELEEKLSDSENSLKQLREQIVEIKVQSAKFRRTLSCLGGEQKWNDEEDMDIQENGQLLNTKIKMQTAEQQRHILRMLEKSLAREMDLEKKLTESRVTEEDLKFRLRTLEQEVFYVEEEAMDASEKWFQAENTAEVLMGISKELLGQLQILQFNLNGSIQRENVLRSKLDGSMEQLNAKENVLQKLESSNAKVNDFLLAQNDSLKASLTEAEDKLILANSEAFTLREKVASIENQLNAETSAGVSGDEQHKALLSEVSELGNVIEDLKEKLSEAEARAESADNRSKLLSDTNTELNEEIGLLRSTCATSERVESLERQLRESDIRLQHAVASAEASQEKQNMLYSTIRDMENLIEGLKLKVGKADNRADNAEEKLIILSESHAELTEEINFLRDRLECLEGSLHQAEEAKMATARDIGIRTKVITNLILQLAVERERLHKQISTLAMENRAMAVKLQKTNTQPSVLASHKDEGSIKETFCEEHDLTTAACMGKETELLPTVCEADHIQKNTVVEESDAAKMDSTSEFETVRRIDAGILNYKHILISVVIVLISGAVYMFQKQNFQF